MSDPSPLENAALIVGIVVGPLALAVSVLAYIRSIKVDRQQRRLEKRVEHIAGGPVAPPFPVIDGYQPYGDPEEVGWFRLFSGGAGATIEGLPTKMSGCALAKNVVNWRSLGSPIVIATGPSTYEPSEVPRSSLLCNLPAMSGQWIGSFCEQPVFFADDKLDNSITDVRVEYQHYGASA